MNDIVYLSKRFLKRNSSTILTFVAAFGVVATSVMSARATTKASKILSNMKEDSPPPDKYEKLKKVVIIYIPTVAIGASTILCLFGANTLNKHKQLSLVSAYSLIGNSFNQYKAKLKELYGEEAHRRIIESLGAEKAKDINITSVTFVGVQNLLPEGTNGQKQIFYDMYSDRFFESTLYNVLSAEYHFNRNFSLRGYVYLNELYEFLGLDKTDYGNTVGWQVEDELYWIDFDNINSITTDGIEYINISIPFGPSPELDYVENGIAYA